MAKAKSTIDLSKVLPSNLSWRRSVDVSEGLMWSVVGDGLVPVEVTETTIRGAIASYNAGFDKAGNPLEGEALTNAQKPDKPNIQRIQTATLDPRANVLNITFSVGIHGANASPDACNSREYMDILNGFRTAATNASLYEELACRQVWALANGGVLWRNGVGTDKRIVVNAVTSTGEINCDFDAQALSGRRNYSAYPGWDAVVAADRNGQAQLLVDAWATSLKGHDYLSLKVSASVRLFHGAEVWPSQEFSSEDKSSSKNDVTRILSFRKTEFEGKAIQRHATLHTQKLGNALRCVDEWHGSEVHGALPVEAFGWIQNEAQAIRTSKNDAYTILRKLPLISASLEAGEEKSRGEALFALSIIIRGGVYVMSSADKNAKDDGDASGSSDGAN